MKRLILVRHASTKAIESGHPRQWDELLSEKGRIQAEALAKRLASMHIDAVYSSPQLRALATAKKIRPGVEIVDDLEDWRPGEKGDPSQMLIRVAEVVAMLPAGTLVLVSHGSPIVMALGYYMRLPHDCLTEIAIVPASISVVQDGIVVAVNDTSHLGIYPETAFYDWRTWTYRPESKKQE